LKSAGQRGGGVRGPKWRVPATSRAMVVLPKAMPPDLMVYAGSK